MAAVLGASLLATQTATAQGYASASNIVRDATINRPTVSPYLNLLDRGGRLPAYQSLVQPLLEQQRVAAQQSQQISQLQQNANDSLSQAARAREQQGLRGTGHRSFHMSYSHYYQVLNQPSPFLRRLPHESGR
jgi:hypothetical protein